MNGLTQSQVENAKNLSCEKCNSEVMKQVFILKVVSGLLTGDGKDTIIPVPVFACNSCGHINNIFSKDLKLKEQSTNVSHVQI